MKKIMMVFGLFLYSLISTGQRLVDSMKEGEIVFNLNFTVLNGNNISIQKLEDYKGKAIIFDFWSTHCATCVSDMPRVLELQKKFQDKVKIFLVTTEPKADVVKLLNKTTKERLGQTLEAGRKLDFITSDTTLIKMFPTVEWGTKVWVDTGFVFRSFTNASSLTEANLNSFLNGQAVRFNKYYKPTLSNAELKDWVSKRIGFTDHLLTYSFISKFDERIYAGPSFTAMYGVDSATNRKISLNCFNLTPLQLYNVAYYGKFSDRNNYCQLEMDSMDQFNPPTETEQYLYWRSQNAYCYALKILPTQQEDLSSILKADLDRFFQLQSSMEKRNITCLVLKRISKEDKIKSRKKEDQEGFVPGYNTQTLVLRNQPMSVLEQYIYGSYIYSSALPMIPFFDETGYENNIDIDLKWRSYGVKASIPELRKELRKYGLDIVEEVKNLNVMVIRKPNNKQ